MKRLFCVLMLIVAPVWGVDPSARQVPVEIMHEQGSFNGQLSISLYGSMNKAKTEWSATLRNTSQHKIFRVTFCVKAFDDSDRQIKPGGNECVLTLWGNNWQPGASLTFKGRQNIKISDDKVAVHVAKYTVAAIEVLDHSPNLRNLDVRCPLVWSSALRVFADKRLRPTVMDKDSFTATYAYDGGTSMELKRYTTTGRGMFWETFRVDSVSLYLREEKPGTCAAEFKMVFAGFGNELFESPRWYAVESNFNFEKELMDALEAQSKRAASVDLDRGIGQLPTDAPKPIESAAKPQLTIISEPGGADIEIDGEFIGNTPSTVMAKEGSLRVTVKKAGFQPWERTLKLNSGDKRTLNAELVK